MHTTRKITCLVLAGLFLASLEIQPINTNTSPIYSSVAQAKTKSHHKETKLEKSRKDLKTIISMPMEKENYLNLEKHLMESANYDDIKDPSNTAAQRKFDNRLKNIKHINKQTSKMYTKSDIKVLTNSDYKLLKKYKKSFDKSKTKWQNNYDQIMNLPNK